MTKLGLRIRLFASIVVALAMLSVLSGPAALAQAPACSVWLIESSRFMKVPFGSFMPDRAVVPGQRKPGQQYSHRRPASEYRRDQMRHRTDPLRYRLETAGLPQD